MGVGVGVLQVPWPRQGCWGPRELSAGVVPACSGQPCCLETLKGQSDVSSPLPAFLAGRVAHFSQRRRVTSQTVFSAAV